MGPTTEIFTFKNSIVPSVDIKDCINWNTSQQQTQQQQQQKQKQQQPL